MAYNFIRFSSGYIGREKETLAQNSAAYTRMLGSASWVLPCDPVYGFLEWESLHIYALSLWQLGKNDQALSLVRILAARVKSMEPRLASTSISFICRLLYYISRLEAYGAYCARN
ncbi:Tetratricopeptide-like helical [Artemisia annua]|uniref:Tetratricopeptide-like helical n=1 Tax=Artemisia annua TaxID=35608 RepID=A0A2U1L1A3_ARTAN|nr:Tetratricopeptide-like helical [Artemisia annua]